MYAKSGELLDRREMLKVKVKSLTEEARIIRLEEKRTIGPLRDELSWHRRSAVRNAARTSYMAYGIIRGRAIERTERPETKRDESYWKTVKAMIEKYGPCERKTREAMLLICQSKGS